MIPILPTLSEVYFCNSCLWEQEFSYEFSSLPAEMCQSFVLTQISYRVAIQLASKKWYVFCSSFNNRSKHLDQL